MMKEHRDDTIDYQESSDILELGEFLHMRPMQDGVLEFVRTEIARYQARLDQLGIQFFSAEEMLFLGGKHHAPGHPCSGKNALPQENLWRNMDATVAELDKLRTELGTQLFINSTYRNDAYNRCVKGATNSKHKDFNAIDFRSNSLAPREVARALKLRRDAGHFVGGIGIYNTFVHIDTRDVNKNFKGDTTPMADFNYVFA